MWFFLIINWTVNNIWYAYFYFLLKKLQWVTGLNWVVFYRSYQSCLKKLILGGITSKRKEIWKEIWKNVYITKKFIQYKKIIILNSIPKHFRQTSWVFGSLIPISKMLHLSNSILIRKTKIFLQDNTWRTVYIAQIKDFIAQDNFPF